MILPILALKGHHYYTNITGSGVVAEKGCYVYMHHISLLLTVHAFSWGKKKTMTDQSTQSIASMI